jgi:hypothetical protein
MERDHRRFSGGAQNNKTPARAAACSDGASRTRTGDLLGAIQEFADAGVDELYIQQIGGGHDEFLEVFAREVLPRFA